MRLSKTLLITLLCSTMLLVGCGSTTSREGATGGSEIRQNNGALGSADMANEVALYAIGMVNTGYRFGGNNPDSGVDCSGMTAYIYKQAANITLPHNAAQQALLGRSIGRNELQAGDLVFFNTDGHTYSHVGLYIGEGRFVHAPSTNKKVSIVPLAQPYFAERFSGARRILE